MPEFNPIYQDADIALVERKIPLEDSTDEQRTVILKIADKEFGFEFSFGKLIHTWEKKMA